MMENGTIAMSSIEDGSMSKAVDDETRLINRRQFLRKHGITAEQTCLVHLEYDGDDYRRYRTITMADAGSGIIRPTDYIADAVFTSFPDLALLLPIADCIAAVLYDPNLSVLGLAHLGRHNLVQNGGRGAIDYMSSVFGSTPADVQVWLSPAAGAGNYPLYDFSNQSLHDVAVRQLVSAGIQAEHISIDPRDTTTDTSLFSHSEFLQGRREHDGRGAVIAMMRA